jgi:beta-glucosidase
MVLLKNADRLRPLTSDALTSIAVIGADADFMIQGGGSAQVQPTYTVTILEGIRQRAGAGVRVEYAEGTDPANAAHMLPGPPAVPSSVLTPAGAEPGINGLYAEYWTNPNFAGEPQVVRVDRQVAVSMGFFNFFNASSLPGLPSEFT